MQNPTIINDLNKASAVHHLKTSIQQLGYRGRNTLSADDFLELLRKNPEGGMGLDVRSEGEFDRGAFPQTYNAPILNNQERHQVGLTFKTQGQDQAILKGLEEVLPQKATRLEAFLKHRPLALFCWRGGLRSKISQAWLAESGILVPRVLGGYKAIRSRLLEEIPRPQPSLYVVSGATGSGKTRFLQSLPSPLFIDLEALANHRGSSFGRPLNGKQPSQSSFENALAFSLYRRNHDEHRPLLPLFVEDESLAIGSVFLPKIFKEQMKQAPMVVLEVDRETRAQNIYHDYIAGPAQQHLQDLDFKASLLQHYQEALLRIHDKLGGLETSKILHHLQNAFNQPNLLNYSNHREWIYPLLEKYYDPLYQYSLEKKTLSTVAYKGDPFACHQWIKTQFD